MLLCALLAFSLPPAACSPSYTVDQNRDGFPDQWYEAHDGRILSLEQDRDYDGRIDCRVVYDREGRRLREELDFNLDGRMDDFYYFEKGELIRQEIDSNFDDRIDIWVYLVGPYIRRYEMDKDFDGRVDLVKDYGS